MIKKIYYDLIPVLIIIAMFGYVLGIYFNLFNIPYLYQITTSTGSKMWCYDMKGYIDNINGAFNGFEELKLEQNPLSWQKTNANMLDSEFWNTLFNNIAYIFNFFIYALNIVLFVFRLIAYIVVNLLCIMGMVKDKTLWKNPSNGLYYNIEPNWLMKTFTWIAMNLQIPFIQP